MTGLIVIVAWWACVIGTYFLASYKGRNRFGWTAGAVFVPGLVLIVLALLPRKIRMVDGYHPDYRRLGS